MEDMNVPHAKTRISIRPSMLVEKKGKGYKDISIGQTLREDTMDYPVHSGGAMSLPITMSASQKRTLKKGGAITIKPAMIKEDAKEALSLHLASAKKIMNSIMKNKGIRHSLKQGEELVDRMTGKGIFGKAFDRFVRKTLGKKAKDTLYKGVEVLKKPLKQAISTIADYAPEIGVSALTGLAVAAGQPELIPLAGMVGKELGKLAGDKGSAVAKDYLDRPGKYQGGRLNIGRELKNIGRKIKSTFSGKVKEYKKNPQNLYADILESRSPVKIPVIDKNPEAMVLRGKGGRLVSTRIGCGSPYVSMPYKRTLGYKQGGSFLPAGGGSIYPAGKYGGMMGCSSCEMEDCMGCSPMLRGCGVDMPIQLGSPNLTINNPAMKPFIPTKGIQSSQIIR